MSVHTKGHPIKHTGKDHLIRLTYQGECYWIPEHVLRGYAQPKAPPKASNVSSAEIFGDFDKKYTRAGALLKGVRSRENMTQVEFAQKIGVTQANLSSMENGRRPIGKAVAKRISTLFKVDYRYFLE